MFIPSNNLRFHHQLPLNLLQKWVCVKIILHLVKNQQETKKDEPVHALRHERLSKHCIRLQRIKDGGRGSYCLNALQNLTELDNKVPLPVTLMKIVALVSIQTPLVTGFQSGIEPLAVTLETMLWRT